MLDQWFDPFYHSSNDQTAFAFSFQTISEFYEIGKIDETGGILKFEGRISRSKLKGLTGKGFKVFVNLSNSGWAGIGSTPVLFLDMTD